MRRSSLVWLILLSVLLGVGTVAAWSLRQPLRESLTTVQHVFRPPAVIRFAVVGDNHGDNPVYRQILDDLQHEDLSFLLNLADATEHGTTAEFTGIKNLEKALPFPVYHIVGNHDMKTDPSRTTFSEVFHQAAWGSHDIGPLHLIRLDNADRKVGFSAEQLDWLEQDLQKNTAPVTVVAYHRPFDLPLAAVFGDDETRASRQTNNRLVDILAKHNIGYIFTGHIHTYLPYSFHGIPAVVSGGGGDPAQAAIGGPANNLFHYLIVTANPTNGTVDVVMHRVQVADHSATE